eukprot:m.772165 g.772165  ORF g.772165 m.772165 type:complete len:475 (-) comp23246_c0_seq23:1630-3054(-)
MSEPGDCDIDDYESDDYVISEMSFSESGFGLVDIFDLIVGKLSATGLKVEEAKNKVKQKAKASVHDVREAVQNVRDDVKEAVRHVKDDMNRVNNRVKERVDQSVSQARARGKRINRSFTELRRRVITGDKKKPVREFVQEVPIVKKVDKISFTMGVLVMILSEYILITKPEKFELLFMAIILPVLFLRYHIYRSLNWGYYLIDFCYFVQLLCFIAILYPSKLLFQVLFVVSSGPLCFAILIWRNSLVFHSLDKVTSTLLHLYPALLMYCWRWTAASPGLDVMCGPGVGIDACVLEFDNWIVWSFAFYGFWQMSYVLITELDGERIRNDKTMDFAVRHLTIRESKKNKRSLYLRITRALGIMGPDELFNYEQWKTKIIFMSVQAVYTIITVVPTILLFYSETLHFAYLLLTFIVALWNGACFYIEVFSAQYLQKLQKTLEHDKIERRRLRSESSSTSTSPVRSRTTSTSATDTGN